MSPTSAILPVGKIINVADDVLFMPGSTKPTILNMWEIVRVSPRSDGKYPLGKLCVAALVRGGSGTVRFRVDVVDALNNTVVRQSQNYPYQFRNRLRSHLVVIRMLDVLFPSAGDYLVELFCENTFVDDQPIQVL